MARVRDHVEIALMGHQVLVGRLQENVRYGMRVLTFTNPLGEEKDYGHSAFFSMEHITAEEARSRFHRSSWSSRRSYSSVNSLVEAGFLPPTKEELKDRHPDCSVYVASSWRNEQRQQAVVQALRDLGCWVYDFRRPQNHPEKRGFSWKEVRNPPSDQLPTMSEYKAMVSHPIAVNAYQTDSGAIQAADVTVLVQPCGRSAHWELGLASGLGKRTYVLLAEQQEPELMISDSLLMISIEDLCADLKEAFRIGMERQRISRHVHDDSDFDSEGASDDIPI